MLHHFRTFDLASLYGSQAAQEMSALRHYLKDKDGKAVAAHLKGMADSWFQVDRNQWRAAMYQDLANSSWYINGGFAAV
ncbi:hypothetical protein DEH69_03710 [Streptomyces sp. PT12]|nr:hypothetical protein DEH69_03710 [Streptomyces sp. PT12]